MNLYIVDIYVYKSVAERDERMEVMGASMMSPEMNPRKSRKSSYSNVEDSR